MGLLLGHKLSVACKRRLAQYAPIETWVYLIASLETMPDGIALSFSAQHLLPQLSADGFGGWQG